MKNKFIILISFASVIFVSCYEKNNQKPTDLKYPKTKKFPVIDTLFHTAIVDNYRWLEDDRSKETEAWVNAENEVTFKSNYRTQWRQITIPYTTSQVSIIYPLFTHSGKGFSDVHKGGFGVSFYNDKAGDGNLKTLGVSLSGAYTMHLGSEFGHNILIFGLQGGFYQKQLDFTNLEWGNQYNPYTVRYNNIFVVAISALKELDQIYTQTKNNK